MACFNGPCLARGTAVAERKDSIIMGRARSPGPVAAKAGSAWRAHVILAAVLAAALVLLAVNYRRELGRALELMTGAPAWLLGSLAVAVVFSYLCRARAYAVPLRAMGHTIATGYLTKTALVATMAHHLVPSGGASGYALITYALHRRGIATARASLLALVDTLSNAVALGSLTLITVLWLLTRASGALPALASVLAPAMGFVAVGGLIYWVQRRRGRLRAAARGIGQVVRRLGGEGPTDQAAERFIEEYFEGKRLIVSRPLGFLRMVAWQYAAVLCQWGALCLIFLSLGDVPAPWLLFSALVLAMAGVSIAAVPGGGGSFELVMSGFFAYQGVELAPAIAATLLYRLATFWVPAVASLIVVSRLRSHG